MRLEDRRSATASSIRVSNYLRAGDACVGLPGAHRPSREEFPFEFCRDLEAAMRSIAGLVAAAVGDNQRAVRLLGDALAVNAESKSWLVDSLRSALALALEHEGRRAKALELLAERLDGDDPSPHLLRTYGWLLYQGYRSDDLTPDEVASLRAEAARAYRLALAVRTDPQWAQTAFNLMSLLGAGSHQPSSSAAADDAQARELLEELVQPGSEYSRTWYVRRARGLNAWRRAVAAWQANDADTTQREASDAAKWYGRALRARPRLQVLYVGLRRPFFAYTRFPPAPILHANLKDAHALAGHRLLAWWTERRFMRTRNKLLKRGYRRFENAQYPDAYANFDWRVVGRQDLGESVAQVNAAVSLWLDGRPEEAEAAWGTALQSAPGALYIRAGLAQMLTDQGFDGKPVPGDEPTDLAEADALVRRLIAAQGASTTDDATAEPGDHPPPDN